MAENSKIEWCDHTFNPWTGCTKVSPGCDHCYAESWAKRSGAVKWGAGEPRRRTTEANWRQPFKWNAQAEAEGGRYRVFCASLADVFDNAADPEWRRDLLRLIAATQSLDWLLLTKRIGNAHAMLDAAAATFGMTWGAHWRNVWLGSTIVNREEMLRDGPKLKAIPAAVRFWSVEPQVEDLGDIPDAIMPDWIIVGGESGPGARDFNIGWARDIVAQGMAAHVPVLVKQLGARPVWTDDEGEPPHWGRITYRDKKGGDWSEWPEDLRVREFPRAFHHIGQDTKGQP